MKGKKKFQLEKKIIQLENIKFNLVWMEGKKQEDSENMIHIGDPLAAYLAARPQVIFNLKKKIVTQNF
jgi:hypothetical protein